MDRICDNPVTFEQAVKLLKSGDLCAFPTETVYGLGADASDSEAVLKIYRTKQRPKFNPLIAHCSNMGMAETIASFSPLARKVAALWPGALTLVLPLRENAQISDLVTAGLNNIGVRVPAHPLARKLIETVGFPLAAPSANPSGKLSPTMATHVLKAFAGKVPVLEGGICAAGVESTILAIDGTRIVQLRSGALTRSVIEARLGICVELAAPDSVVRAPGMLHSHYAPKAKIRLNAERAEPGEAFLGFGEIAGEGPLAKNLSKTGDLGEAAQNLFSYLHILDGSDTRQIAVAPIPQAGLGEAINDRLTRAAAPRN